VLPLGQLHSITCRSINAVRSRPTPSTCSFDPIGVLNHGANEGSGSLKKQEGDCQPTASPQMLGV
jgi:hypothetical protein